MVLLALSSGRSMRFPFSSGCVCSASVESPIKEASSKTVGLMIRLGIENLASAIFLPYSVRIASYWLLFLFQMSFDIQFRTLNLKLFQYTAEKEVTIVNLLWDNLNGKEYIPYKHPGVLLPCSD